MAITYTEKVGQFSKKKSAEQMQRPLILTLLFVVVCVGALCFAAGWSVGERAAANYITLGIIALAVGMWRVRHLVDKALNAAHTRRIALLRGGQAEAYVSILLRDDLPESWHLFDNLQLDATSDIDHVLVGPGGLFVISTKSQRGLFAAAAGDNRGTFNHEDRDWIQDVARQAMRLKDQLSVIETAKQPWLQTVLALPFAHVDTDLAKNPNGERVPGVGSVWVLHEDNLLEHLAPDTMPRHRKLDKASVERWAAALKTLHERYAPCGGAEGK